MRINGASIVKSLFIITILFFVFAIGAYVLKDFLYNSSKDSLTIKSSDNLEIILNNNLPLSDKLALQNNKDTVSGDIFKNIQFEVINTHKGSLDFELYLTKEEREHLYEEWEREVSPDTFVKKYDELSNKYRLLLNAAGGEEEGRTKIEIQRINEKYIEKIVKMLIIHF